MHSSLDLPPFATVFEAFEATTRNYPSQPFLHIPASATESYAKGSIDYSYAQAAEKIKKLRDFYSRSGIAGHRVALMLENRPEFFFHWLALNALGASIVPMNPEYRRQELQYLLVHSETMVAVVLDTHVERVRNAVVDACGLKVIGLGDLEAGLARLQGLAAQTPAPTLSSECALVYTSGTTGKPKGCLLSNEYFLMQGQRYLNRRGHVQLETARSRVLTPLPLFHINALASSTMGMILSGGCVIQLDRFHPRSFWADVVSSRATGMHCLGVMPAILLALPHSSHEREHLLRYATAANLDSLHHAAFEDRFGVPLIEGWSMTETGAGAAISADTEPRHVGTRCFGKVPDTLEVRIVNDVGTDVTPGEAGELLVRRRGDNPRLGFFSGYFKDPQATEQAWREGWWHTGDVVRLGPDGSLHFVDRIKNLIRRSGENISALEVEQILRSHPAIADVVVTAVPDTMRGEEVMACVVLSDGTDADVDTAEQVTGWALREMAYFKVPGWISFVAALPTTATQKLERGKLKEIAEGLIGTPSCFDVRARKRRESAGTA